MIDLNSLAIFAKVVETRSFSEAAKRLNMPISTVSWRVAELEDQLGVGLLERSTRNLRLTDVGAEVFEQAQTSAEISEAVGNMSIIYGLGRLAAVSATQHSDPLLVPLVTAFPTSYPDVRVHILVTDRLVDHIAEGMDLAIAHVTNELSDQASPREQPVSQHQELIYKYPCVCEGNGSLAGCSLSQHDKNGARRRVISAEFCCRQRQLLGGSARFAALHVMAALGAELPVL